MQQYMLIDYHTMYGIHFERTTRIVLNEVDRVDIILLNLIQHRMYHQHSLNWLGQLNLVFLVQLQFLIYYYEYFGIYNMCVLFVVVIVVVVFCKNKIKKRMKKKGEIFFAPIFFFLDREMVLAYSIFKRKDSFDQLQKLLYFFLRTIPMIMNSRIHDSKLGWQYHSMDPTRLKLKDDYLS